MSRPSIVPVDRETPLGIEELFISTTDRKGIIRMSNAVFVRVSGYAEEELFGQAHNIVRHPDMPRAVFKLFWEYLEAGRPVAAYVKNLSRDGSFYWVMAIAVPVETGYVSVRLKPTTPLLAEVQEIYRELVALERRVEDGEPRRRKEAIAASSARLGELLTEAGFASYDDFMRAALPAEMVARDAALGDRGHVHAATATGDAIGRVAEACATTQGQLVALSANLRAYSELSGTLDRKSAFVLQLADDIRLFSLNALLASARLTDGAALEAVADLMRARSDNATPVIRRLSEEITASLALLSEMGFRMAAARLQSEMMTVFVAEHTEDRAGIAEQLQLLATTVGEAVGEVCTALESLDGRLRIVAAQAVALKRELEVVRALEVNGRVEASRAADAADVQTLFATIGSQVREAKEEIGDFDQVAVLVARRDARAERAVRDSAEQVHRAVAALSA